jgi:hypothetical protein|tara:strand:- start:145 stop:345 length:201 start_codon:yes stop_codon:yes gene_type:complete
MARNKIKESTKEYKRDSKGKMLKQYSWRHYTVHSTSTKELLTYYTNPNFKRKKEMIRLELIKRNAI